MKQTYSIEGMTCNHCRSRVEEALNKVEGANTTVTLDPPLATITMEKHIDIDVFQKELSKLGDYIIHEGNDHAKEHACCTDNHQHSEMNREDILETIPEGKFYCPMFCESDKYYDKTGKCPVCGMFLKERTTEMEHKYVVSGMTCNHCRTSVEAALNGVGGVTAEVSLDPALATIRMKEHIDVSVFQKAIVSLGSHYKIEAWDGISPIEVDNHVINEEHKTKAGTIEGGKYYCPMFCEGDKVHDKAGDCSVCGMSLVKAPMRNQVQYICPMHPEVIEDIPGSCSICGMDLVATTIEEEDTTYKDLLKKFKVALAFTIPVFILSMGEMIPGDPIGQFIPKNISNWIQFALSLPVVFYATWIFYQRAWTSFKTMNLNMFTLVGVGTGAAFIFSIIALLFPDIFPEEFKHGGHVYVYFEAVVVILTLVLLGQVLEASAYSKTNTALKELLKLAPTDATIVRNGKEEVISIDEIQKGDILRVKPGGKIPVDGYIHEGVTNIDESMISGEPIPVDKVEGDKVSSGTINGTKSFTMIAEKVGEDTLLSQIITMVEEASRSRAPIQKLTDRVSQIFVPVVISIAIITFIVWAIFGGESAYIYALSNALAVLIIACPCALGLATPMSIMVGMGRGAKNGILIKNAESLERFDKVDVLITDKTGTITEGKPSMNQAVSFDGFREEDIVAYSASLNQHSEHPLAVAILDYAKSKNITVSEVMDFDAVTGKGVVGVVDGKKLALGNQALMNDVKAVVSPEMVTIVAKEQNQGKTVSFLAVGDRVAGFVAISDAIKATSREAISSLIKQGVEVVMLTGDNKITAAAVAKELGIVNFRGECLPGDKLDEIKKLQAQGKVVAMAGDGINDAPALAQSDIGIAMGTGTDVAIESASLTLLHGDLLGIVKAKNLSHSTMKNIKQNLFFAFVYNSLGIPIAAGVLYPFFGILMSPMIAAAAMSMSSICVIVNSLRLKNAKL